MGTTHALNAPALALVAISGVGVALSFAGCGGAPLPIPPAAQPPPPVAEAKPPAPMIVLPPPPDVTDPTAVAEVGVGDFHSCARMGDGTVRCWGRNKHGQLGDGTQRDRTTPVKVVGISGARQIALGTTFSCALLPAKTVRCWGTGRIVADGRMRQKIAPTAVPGLTDVVEISASGYVTCARMASGKAQCWGLEHDGKKTSSVTLGPVHGVVEVAAASSHACLRLDGAVRCVGEAPWSTTFTTTAIAGAGPIATGDGMACAIVDGGQVTCFGRNEHGQLGIPPDGELHTTPVAVRDVRGAVRISAGETQVCVVLGDATVRCWGGNAEGELGLGTRTMSEPPHDVSALKDVAEIALGSVHGCARTRDGHVVCWGANGAGQLGDGSTERRLAPARVAF